MRCCVIIMGCKFNPGLRNMEAIYDTYITLYNKNKKDFDNEYDFYFYDGGNEKFSVEKYKEYANIIHCVSGDDISNTYQKSLESYKWIVENKKYDWIIRVNISTYINLYVLDKFLNCANKNTIYANQFCAYLYNWHYLNDCFPRGDAHIIHFEIFKKAIEKSEELDISKINDGTDKVDDVLLGMLYIKAYEDLYVNNYQTIYYNFLPEEINDIKNNPKLLNDSAYCIFTRLKTCPPNTQSSYSWNDNEYRQQDIIKFEIINFLIEKNKKIYNSVSNSDIFNGITENSNINCLIPYMNLEKSSLDSISFEDLKNVIIKKHSKDIIY